jgi:hypothetical protein
LIIISFPALDSIFSFHLVCVAISSLLDIWRYPPLIGLHELAVPGTCCSWFLFQYVELLSQLIGHPGLYWS